jgi:ABC-type multidrug transport system fused ATPase/permease subunit
MVILFVLEPILASAFLVIMVPIVLITIVYGHKIRMLQKDIQSEKAIMSNIAEESFGNIRTVKAFSNEEEEIRKFNIGNATVY